MTTLGWRAGLQLGSAYGYSERWLPGCRGRWLHGILWANNALLGSVPITKSGNGESVLVDVGLDDVDTMVVNLFGSAAVTAVNFA
jgi:hypothetical protein